MKIRVGIVGFGFMGQMHARVYQSLPDLEIAGVVDPSAELPVNLQKMGIKPAIFTSLSDLCQSPQIDVIDICLPTDLHAEAIIQAAQAGKHIFCEKPLALELAEAEDALQAVEKSGVIFQVGQCIRFWPEYQALEKFVRSGRGGKLVSLNLTRRASRPSYSRENWLMDSRRSKGAALDLHIHDTDFVLHLLGKPKAVHSVGRLEKGAWARLFTQYVYDSVAVTAEGAWDLPPKWGFQMAFQAVFENAVIDFDILSSPTLHLTVGSGERRPMAFDRPAVGDAGSAGGNISDLGGYYNEIACFCSNLKVSKKAEIATGRQAFESLRTVLAEIESAATGAVISL